MLSRWGPPRGRMFGGVDGEGLDALVIFTAAPNRYLRTVDMAAFTVLDAE